MELNRVNQILSSSATIEVHFKGVPVWIDQVNEDGQTAIVHLKDPRSLEERTTVAISDLEEI
ncbi:H-type small acid-soluble spore protein [Bacillus sp. N9]